MMDRNYEKVLSYTGGEIDGNLGGNAGRIGKAERRRLISYIIRSQLQCMKRHRLSVRVFKNDWQLVLR